jgi:DNA-binding NarL/FixJ family response regulator
VTLTETSPARPVADDVPPAGLSTRIWIDDRHPVFRRGIASLLATQGLNVVGESAGLDPTPARSSYDLLVFEATPAALARVMVWARPGGIRCVAVLPVLREQLVYQALDAGVAAVLLREEIEAAPLVATLSAVAAGHTTLPSDLVPGLLDRAAREASAGSRVLADRELSVLRLLAEGSDTVEIGETLGYSERTVKNIVHDVLMKTNCRNRTHAVALATREGLI